MKVFSITLFCLLTSLSLSAQVITIDCIDLNKSVKVHLDYDFETGENSFITNDDNFGIQELAITHIEDEAPEEGMIQFFAISNQMTAKLTILEPSEKLNFFLSQLSYQYEKLGDDSVLVENLECEIKQ
jgi:hypothetical protein